MTWINAKCRDSLCKGPSGCAHRGPQGQWCYFDLELKLCEILQIDFEDQTIDSLLTQIRDKIDSRPSNTEAYTLAIQKAQDSILKLKEPNSHVGPPAIRNSNPTS